MWRVAKTRASERIVPAHWQNLRSSTVFLIAGFAMRALATNENPHDST
ncbi:MAG TPA: hypothetical protein VKB50_17395 [Vicinamibacterales bacterium]|nr:hypothetical protein [Vicinamibacterales bacterium]